MQEYRLSEVAQMVGVSDDTVRRWIEAGRIPAARDKADRMVVSGEALAVFLQELASKVSPSAAAQAPVRLESTRNRFPGIVTGVIRGSVMAQIEIQSGPARIVSLIALDAVDELGLEVGVAVVAAVEATSVAIEMPILR